MWISQRNWNTSVLESNINDKINGVIPGEIPRRVIRRICFILVSSGYPLEIAAHVFVHWVWRSVVRESSEYQRCFQETWLILWGEFTNFMVWVHYFYGFIFFLFTMKYVLIISSPRNYRITIRYQFPPFFTLPLHYVSAMFFIRFGKCKGVRHFALKMVIDDAKMRVEMPHFNNSKVFWNPYAHTCQRIKNYFFYCSVFEFSATLFLRKRIKP
jgi:hypothetical protein